MRCGGGCRASGPPSTSLCASRSRQALETAETTLGTLHAKQGRKNQFKTQKERDAHLRTLIKEHGASIQTREQNEANLDAELTAAKEELEQLQTRASDLRHELDGRKESLARLGAELAELRERVDASEKLVELGVAVCRSERAKQISWAFDQAPEVALERSGQRSQGRRWTYPCLSPSRSSSRARRTPCGERAPRSGH